MRRDGRRARPPRHLAAAPPPPDGLRRRRTMVAGFVLMAIGVACWVPNAQQIARRHDAVAAYDALAPAGAGDVDWAELRAANPDVVAWCRVEGAGIDLPVCQAKDDDPHRWLARDLWGGKSPAGTPYVDHRAGAESPHVLCYGHHLAGTGGMFSALGDCHAQDAFDRTLAGGLAWSTPQSSVRLRPLCASVVDQEDALVQRFDFAGVAELRAWLAGLVARSTAKATDAEALAATATRAVTLVTCSSDVAGQRGRTVVTFAA